MQHLKKLFKYILLLLLFNFQLSYPQTFNINKNSTIKVQIIQSATRIKFKPLKTFFLTTDANQCYQLDTVDYLLTLKDNTFILTNGNDTIKTSNYFNIESNDESSNLLIYDVPYGVGWWWEGKQNRTYNGIISFFINNKKIQVINELNIEYYLCGVVPSEIGKDTPLEALKAQAVAARSETFYALYKGLYKGNNYDICADVECQVFAGTTNRTPLSDTAVFTTAGIALFDHNNLPISGFFASNCGGFSEDIENVWSRRPNPDKIFSSHFDNDTSYNIDLTNEQNLINFIDNPPITYCNPAYHNLPTWSNNNFRWQRIFTKDTISYWLNKKKNIGKLDTIKVLKRGKSGRIIDAYFIGTKDSLYVKSELEFRQVFNPPLRSSCCYIKYTGDTIIVKGAGWGHGVGMCQSGAIGRAKAGQNFMQILKHYFQNAAIRKVY